MRSISLFLLFFLIIAPYLHADEIHVRNAWKKDVIYFIVTDRFFNGDRSNDINIDKNNIRGYHGGDLLGIIKKLDYLKELGVSAIWFSPVMDNRDTYFYGGSGYHGYWIKDFYTVDEHLGNIDTLKLLSKECKKRNIKIILDIVVNHTDWNAGFKEKGFCHEHGNIENWDDQNEIEIGDIYGMPDFDQSKSEVYDFLLNMTKYWIDITDCDGIRFDAVKHVGHDFWKKYLADLRVHLKHKKPEFLFLGEVLHGDPYYVLDYLKDGFDSVFDFPMYYHFNSVFAEGKSVFPLIEEMKKDRLYRNPELMSPFLDNHDVKRFMSRTKNHGIKRMKLALTALLTYRGVPTLYYGSEIPFLGDNEDESRKDMIFEKKEMKLFDHIRNLIKIRRTYSSLHEEGYLQILLAEDDLFAYSRISSSHETILIFNLSDKEHKKIWIPLPKNSCISKSSKIKDVLNHYNLPVFKGKIYAKLPPLSAAVIPYQCSKNFHEKDIKENLIRPDYSAVIENININFSVAADCSETDRVYIIGSHENIGKWNKDSAVLLKREDNSYKCSVSFPTNTDIEYKFIIIDKNNTVTWENGNNRTLKLTRENKDKIITCVFKK